MTKFLILGDVHFGNKKRLKEVTRQLKLLKSGNYFGTGDEFTAFTKIKLSNREIKKRMKIFMKLISKIPKERIIK